MVHLGDAEHVGLGKVAQLRSGRHPPAMLTHEQRLAAARVILDKALADIDELSVGVYINPDPGGSMWSDHFVAVKEGECFEFRMLTEH